MYILLVLQTVLLVLATCEISIENIQGFFNYTYDANQDGYATREEFL